MTHFSWLRQITRGCNLNLNHQEHRSRKHGNGYSQSWGCIEDQTEIRLGGWPMPRKPQTFRDLYTRYPFFEAYFDSYISYQYTYMARSKMLWIPPKCFGRCKVGLVAETGTLWTELFSWILEPCPHWPEIYPLVNKHSYGKSLVNKHSYGKSPFGIGKSTVNDPFSIAMLSYQRVCVG